MTDIVQARVDTSKGKQDLDDLEQRSKRTLVNIATGIRRTAEIGIYTAEALGFALDQVIVLAIQSGLRVVEFLVATEAAITAGTLGLNIATGRLAAQAGAIGFMFLQINALMNAKTEVARRTGMAVSALRAATF